MSHQKHTHLAKPFTGQYHRNEIAILGAACPLIQQLCLRITGHLSALFKIAYMDAEHRSESALSHNRNTTFMSTGAWRQVTDKQEYSQCNIQGVLPKNEYRRWLSGSDLVLINGNHFEGEKQILILDPVKYDSLKRNMHKLSNVVLVLTTDKASDLPLFLKDIIPDHERIPSFSIAEDRLICDFISQLLQNNLPAVQGLVLTGGKSLRMGKDKSLLEYNGIPQRKRAADLLMGLGIPTYFSCREDQRNSFDNQDKVITDTFADLGPMSGILSAFRSQPDVAWLTIATDLPLLNRETLNYLLSKRNPSAIATAFCLESTGFPEPLITIWEPAAYPLLLDFLSQGISCPRKVLINAHTHLIAPPDAEALMNVNVPADYDLAMELIQNHQPED